MIFKPYRSALIRLDGAVAGFNGAAVVFAGFQQFGVGADGLDLTVHQNDDPGGVDQGREPVSDHQGGAAFGQTAESVHHIHLIFSVQRAGRFIQDEDGSVFQQGARQTEPLHLADAEPRAAVADRCVVPLGQLLDEFRGMDLLRDLLHFRLGSAFASKEDIIPQSARQDQRLLVDDRDMAAQGIQIVPAQIDSVDLHGALFRIEKAGNQFGQSRFAGTAGTDDRHELARFHTESGVLDNGTVDLIAESDVFKLDRETVFALCIQSDPVGRRGDRGRSVQYLKNAGDTSLSVSQSGTGQDQLLQRFIELAQIGDEHDQLAHRQTVGQHFTRAGPDDPGHAQRKDRGHSRLINDLGGMLAQTLAPGILDKNIELLGDPVLADKTLDGWDGVDRLLDKRGHLAVGLVRFHTAELHHLTIDPDAQDEHRQSDARDESQHLVQLPHHPQHTEHGKETGRGGEPDMLEKCLERIRVPADPVDHVALFLIEKITLGKILHPVEDLLADRAQTFQPDADDHIILERGHSTVDQMHCENGDCAEEYLPLTVQPGEPLPQTAHPSGQGIVPQDGIQQQGDGPRLEDAGERAQQQQSQPQTDRAYLGAVQKQYPVRLNELPGGLCFVFILLRGRRRFHPGTKKARTGRVSEKR